MISQIHVLALVLFSILANAVVVLSHDDGCKVGDWEAWESCTSSRHCPGTKEQELPVYSYHMEAREGWDSGREKMEIIMKQKEERRKWRAECIPAGTCPELLERPSSGPFSCVAGLAGDIPCNNIHQLSFVNIVDLGYAEPLPGDIPEGNDIWGWTDPESGDEYAIVGLTGGTSFVRITDPTNPVPVGYIHTATSWSTWRDIKVIGNYAYIVSEARDHGLQVFDLTRLRGLTSLHYFEPDAVNNDFGNAHNIVSNEDTKYLYVVGATQSTYPSVCKGGLMIFDVQEPLNPTFVTCFGKDGYTHDAQCVIYNGPDTPFVGREVCFSFNEDSLTIVDVTDKNEIFMIAKTGYYNVAYSHQGWVNEDHSLLLLDDELDERGDDETKHFTKTYVWDIRVLRSPQLKAIYQSSQKSIDHNQYIIGDFTYQANYESGLRVLHINPNTYRLTQVAYFDVLPSRTTPQFFGTWSVYPFFASGTVVVNSIDYGLFVVKLDWDGIQAQLESGQDYAEEVRTRPIIHKESGAICPAVSETRICTAASLC